MQENGDDDILLELFLCIDGFEIVEKSLCLKVKLKEHSIFPMK